MRNIDVQLPEKSSTTMADMKVNDYAIVIDNNYKGHVIYKVHDKLVADLSNDDMWDKNVSQNMLKVSIYPKGTKLTIEV